MRKEESMTHSDPSGLVPPRLRIWFAPASLIASFALGFLTPPCALGKDNANAAPLVDKGENGQLNPAAVKMLRDAGVKTDRIVFAMRTVDGAGGEDDPRDAAPCE